MRTILAVAIFLISIGSSVAASGLDGAAQWWTTLTQDEQYEIQEDLVLLGRYDGLVDATFGPATDRAIRGFEKSIGDPPDGTLSKAALANLHGKGTAAFDQMGMALMILDKEGVGVYAPRALLSQERREPEGGTTFVTPDQNFSLYAMGWEYTAQKYASLAEELLSPTSRRTITYESKDIGYAIASGRKDGKAYYSLLMVDHDRIVGVEISWSDSYADVGAIAATFAASYSGAKSSFDPPAQEEPFPQEEEPQAEPPAVTQSDPVVRRTADAAIEAQTRHQGDSPAPSEPPIEAPSAAQVADLPGQQIGPFYVPSANPNVILLDGEILPGATLEFRRALRAQPNATTLMLVSPGGSVNEGLNVAHLVADRKLETIVPDNAGCYSACAFIFFAGSPRTVDGELGVHQIYGDGIDASDTQVVLSDVLDALNEFGVPQEVVSTMLRTRPQEMHIFTRSEIDKLAINRSP